MLEKRFPIIISFLFLIVAGIGIYNHEMWRDEFEIFMRVRDAQDFLKLFSDKFPIPDLYFSLLYLTIKIWPYPVVFQIFHLLIITGAVFMFNKFSPFTYVQKIFFSFSYFVLFEYGIISRDYSMLLLLLFMSVYLITREKQNIIAIAISLILLANHHLYGVFFSLSLFLYEAIHIINRARILTSGEKRRLKIAGALMIAGCLFIIPKYLLYPQANRWAMFFGQAPFFMTLRSVWNAFVPVPEIASMQFWNTNILPFPQLYSKQAAATEFITAGNMTAVAVSIFFLLAGVIIFLRKLPVLIVFLANTAVHLAFLQYLSVFYVRYQGILLVIFIYNYWLLSYSDTDLPFAASKRISDFSQEPFFTGARRYASPFFTFVLFIQFCVGIFCYVQDARYPFTASYKTADYISKEKLDDNIMVGYRDYAVQPIAGLLNRRIYYPQSKNFRTFADWSNKARRENITLSEVVSSAVSLAIENRGNALLILNFPLLDQRKNPIKRILLHDNIELLYLRGFTETIVPDEEYFLYLLHKM